MGHRPAEVDGRQAWVVMCGCFVVNLLAVGYMRSFGMLFVRIQEEFASSAAMTSAMLAVSGAVQSVAAFLANNVMLEFVSERAVVILGGAALAGGVILSSRAPDIVFFIFSNGVVEGLGHAFVYSPGFVMLSKYFDRRRPLAAAVASSGVSVGAMILPVLIRYLLDNYGVRGTLLLLGAIMLHTVAAGALYRPLPLDKVQQTQQTQLHHHEDNESADTKVKPELLGVDLGTPKISLSMEGLPRHDRGSLASTGPFSKSLGDLYDLDHRSEHWPQYTSLAHIPSSPDSSTDSPTGPSICSRVLAKSLAILDLSLFRKPLFVIVMIYCFFGIVANNFPVIFLPPLAEEKGISEDKVSMMLMLTGASSISGRLLVGLLANAGWVSTHYIAAASFLLLGVACLLTRLYVTYNWLVMFSILYGLLEGAYFALMPIIVIDFLGLQNLAKTFGFIQLVHGAACAAMFPFIGSVKDMTGNYDVPYIVIGLCSLLSCGALLLEPLRRIRCSSKSVEHGPDVAVSG